MISSVFLSHNSVDKPFVRQLACDLENQGVSCWLDEAEIKVGESLIEKIRAGIDSMEYMAVVLSPDSVASPWVQREVDVAMTQEIHGKRVRVLPILYRRCEMPGFLLGKKYADFTEQSQYAEALAKLVQDMGVVFNRAALHGARPATGLGTAIDKAAWKGLRLLSRPFHRPFQYMGMSIADASSAVGVPPNEARNIVVETDECRMFLESEGNFVNYVEVDIKRTAPHQQNQEFDSEPVLGVLSINPAELELIRRQTHCHTYHDHRKRLQITVMCAYDGEPLSVAFSAKYYGISR